ncbi:MAG: cytochrome d ubiquinol oxidase subunit II [Pseudomonadales bacterium]
MAEFLPVFYFFVMGLALLVYVVLDGYDLGIGLLFPWASDAEKDLMIASIGPFWDANETWIVLGVGVLLIAFPHAHGEILSSLYIPVTLMLLGLVLRGVAFEFRVKAGERYKSRWNKCFFTGSLIASLSQGWMLGAYITALEPNTISRLFSFCIALALPALYVLLGCAWLLIKTEGDLYRKAINWAQIMLAPMTMGLILVSVATPLVSESIAEKWFTVQSFIGLLPIPLSCGIALVTIAAMLRHPDWLFGGREWFVFAALLVICLMAGIGLAYSLYPYIIIDRLTLWEAAAATESLQFIAYGVVLSVPAIAAYTAFTYWVFRGKSSTLSYGEVD